MKHIIAALFFVLFLGACSSGGGTPWDRNAAVQPAQQAPSALGDGKAQPDPRMAHYRGITTPHGQYGGEYGAQSSMTAPIPAPAVNAPPVKVALLVPLSGPQAELGQAMLNAAQLAMFDMNYTAFELMPRDTGNTPDAARAAAASAIAEGAQLILGPVFADAVRAVKPVAAQAGVNVVAFSTDWTTAGGNGYVMGFLPFGQVNRIASYAAANRLNRVGILAPDNAYGTAVVNAWQSAARGYGLPAPAVTRFAPGASNLSDIVKNFTRYDQRQGTAGQPAGAAPYDAVFLPVGGEQATAIAGLLRFYEMGPEHGVKLLGTGLWDDNALARDPALTGAWFAAPQPDLRAAFERNYRNTYGGMAPPRLASLAYDATALAIVLARNGAKNGGQPQFNNAALTNPNGFAGIDGIFRFRPDGLVERGQAVLTFKDMTIQMVDRAPATFQHSGI